MLCGLYRSARMASPLPTGMVFCSTVSSDVDFYRMNSSPISFCITGIVARFSGGFMFVHRLKSG